MAVKTSVTKKRLLRWAAAILAALVTSFVGLYPLQLAQSEAVDCTRDDVLVWQSQIANPAKEASPADVLKATEAFLAICPTHPEVKEAYRIAGVSAVRTGDAERALIHFDRAGWIRDRPSLFAQASAFLAIGETDMGWVIRDEIIEDWHREVSRSPRSSIDEIKIQTGTIYKVSSTDRTANNGPVTAWVGVPQGAGWPATLSVKARPHRPVTHRLDTAAPTTNRLFVEFNRCQDRKLLGVVEVSSEDMEETVQLALKAYLAEPDLYASQAEGRISQCYAPQRLLPTPRP